MTAPERNRGAEERQNGRPWVRISVEILMKRKWNLWQQPEHKNTNEYAYNQWVWISVEIQKKHDTGKKQRGAEEHQEGIGLRKNLGGNSWKRNMSTW